MTRPTCEGWWEYILDTGNDIGITNDIAWIDARDLQHMIDDHEYSDGFVEWTGRHIESVQGCDIPSHHDSQQIWTAEKSQQAKVKADEIGRILDCANKGD